MKNEVLSINDQKAVNEIAKRLIVFIKYINTNQSAFEKKV